VIVLNREGRYKLIERNNVLKAYQRGLGNEMVQSMSEYLTDPVVVSGDVSVQKAVAEMIEKRVEHGVVIDEKGSPRGVFSSKDFLSLFLYHIPQVQALTA